MQFASRAACLTLILLSAEEFTGVNCETLRGECYKEPCKNGGSCAQGKEPADFSCTCPEEWTGMYYVDTSLLWYFLFSLLEIWFRSEEILNCFHREDVSLKINSLLESVTILKWIKVSQSPVFWKQIQGKNIDRNSITSDAWCPPGPTCEEAVVPCDLLDCANDGVCEKRGDSAFCECPIGYGGFFTV